MKARTALTLTVLVMTANAVLVGYVYGYRLANFSEIPTSQRPAGIYTQATIDTVLADIYSERD